MEPLKANAVVGYAYREVRAERETACLLAIGSNDGARAWWNGEMDGWARIAPHLYIWDYVVNFSHDVLPYPNFRVLASNIRFFRDHRAIGIMEQGAYQCRGGEFAELRAYVLARLLWNPGAAVEPIVADFMNGYYGRAGQFVQAYFDLLHGQLRRDTHIHLGLQADDALFSHAFVGVAGALFDQAETVAETDAIRRRVELARLPVLYLKCKRSPVVAQHDGTYARFHEIVRSHAAKGSRCTPRPGNRTGARSIRRWNRRGERRWHPRVIDCFGDELGAASVGSPFRDPEEPPGRRGRREFATQAAGPTPRSFQARCRGARRVPTPKPRAKAGLVASSPSASSMGFPRIRDTCDPAVADPSDFVSRPAAGGTTAIH